MAIYRTQTVITGLGGAPYLSTLYFVGGLGSTPDFIQATGQFWRDLRTVVVGGVTMTVNAEVATIDEATGQITGVNVGTSQTTTGTATGDPVPLTTQGLVQWRTGAYEAGRQVRGRTFIPGASEASSAAGRPTSDYRGYVQIAANNLIANTATELGVWSRSNGLVRAVTAATTWTEFAVLRSRRD